MEVRKTVRVRVTLVLAKGASMAALTHGSPKPHCCGWKANSCPLAESHVCGDHREPTQPQYTMCNKRSWAANRGCVWSPLPFKHSAWTDVHSLVSWSDGMCLSFPKRCALSPHPSHLPVIVHMLTLELVWENPSLIRHGFAPVCLGSHCFYPAADSSLQIQFSPTTISSHTKCPEPNFLSNEHLKRLQAQWKQALKEKKWGECMNSDSDKLQKTLQSSPPKLFHTQDFSFYASPVYYIKETE